MWFENRRESIFISFSFNLDPLIANLLTWFDLIHLFYLFFFLQWTKYKRTFINPDNAKTTPGTIQDWSYSVHPFINLWVMYQLKICTRESQYIIYMFPALVNDWRRIRSKVYIYNFFISNQSLQSREIRNTWDILRNWSHIVVAGLI